MKKYIINEALVEKIKALIGSATINVVMGCNEKNIVLNELDQLKEYNTEDKPSKHFYHVYYDTFNNFHDEILIESQKVLSFKEVVSEIEAETEQTVTSTALKEIFKEEYDLLRKDIKSIEY